MRATAIYAHGITVVKRYKDDLYRVTYLKSKRMSGWEEDIPITDERAWRRYLKKDEGTCKERNNISRAKNKVFEYAICNEWDYFVTLTIDKEKYNREDINKYRKDLTQFIRHIRQGRYGGPAYIKYILIPELHSDGTSWHMHGLLSGIKKEMLEKFERGSPRKLKMFMNWPEYQKKFGFCSVGEIKNKEAVAKYITKYITKELDKSVKELGHHMYYVSRGLKQAVKIEEGFHVRNPDEWDFENIYCKIKWMNKDNIITYMNNNIKK